MCYVLMVVTDWKAIRLRTWAPCRDAVQACRMLCRETGWRNSIVTPGIGNSYSIATPGTGNRLLTSLSSLNYALQVGLTSA